MTSVQIIPGAPYNIQSPYIPGGLVQFANITTSLVNATLGTNITSLSQQWTFQPTDATNTTYTILNVAFNTSYLTAASGSSLLVSNPGTQTWYLRPIDAVYYSICYNAECSLVWAPWAEVGGPLTATEVMLSPSANATGSELWRIIPASTPNATTTGSTTVTVTASASISTTTSGTPYLPSGSSAPSPIPEQPAELSRDLRAINSCAPCGKSKCQFTPSLDNATTTASYSVIIGQPVANCVPGNSENTKTTLGGTFELEYSFSIEWTAGTSLGLIGPSAISTTTIRNYSSTKTTKSQEIEVSIPPGQIGGLVANISYYSTPGKMKVDDRTLSFVQIEPDDVIGYSVVYVPCGNPFSALTLPKAECLSNAASSLKGVSLMSVWLVLTVMMNSLGFLSV